MLNCNLSILRKRERKEDMPTIKDVAKRAGVAVSTASYALNNRPEIRKETREKVLQAAQELNYRPSGIARDLRKTKTETVGLLLPNLYGPFYSELIQAVEEVVFSNGYHLIAGSSHGGDKSTAMKFLQEKRSDGVLVFAQDLSNEVLRQIAAKDFPIILLGQELAGDYIWSISVNTRQGAYNLVNHLIKLNYTTIGFLSGPTRTQDNRDRFDGYQQALQEHNMSVPQQWVVQGHFIMEGGYHAAQTLLLQKDLPQAIVAANDEMAIGAMRAFQDAGLRIPEDIAIAGFDDIVLSRYISPKLTTVRQPIKQMANLATHMLFQALNGNFSIENARLEAELVIRESC
jgi:LacI family transcriptional regulator